MTNNGDTSYNIERPNPSLITTAPEQPIYTPESPMYTPEVPLNINTLQSPLNKNKHQSIIYTGEYEFLNINSFWSHEIYIPQEPVCNIQIQNK